MKILAGLRPEKFTPKSEPSVTFELQPLTAAERLDVLMCMENAKKYGTGIQLACEYSIRGWTGVTGEDDKPLPFSAAAVARLPLQVLIEVGTHVLQISKLDDGEKKASDMPSA